MSAPSGLKLTDAALTKPGDRRASGLKANTGPTKGTHEQCVPKFARSAANGKDRGRCGAFAAASAMIAVIVVPLGRLNSASTAACFDRRVL
jgi:hypothetical protein